MVTCVFRFSRLTICTSQIQIRSVKLDCNVRGLIDRKLKWRWTLECLCMNVLNVLNMLHHEQLIDYNHFMG